MYNLLWFAVLFTMRKDNTWFPTYCWKGTDTSTKKLVPPSRASDFKIKSLVELAKFFWPESYAKSYWLFGLDYPPICSKLWCHLPNESITTNENEIQFKSNYYSIVLLLFSAVSLVLTVYIWEHPISIFHFIANLRRGRFSLSLLLAKEMIPMLKACSFVSVVLQFILVFQRS